ncbi:MAG: hypothetical protein JWL96_4568 [Sphingomonas bacterium]|uniref:DUF6544 family protein n=1 Tax=Sphingomonas bacterium TaxID=1895847 RepID=UPI002A4E5F45|nr:hypothetical protein [Sphingomonas bacterium]
MTGVWDSGVSQHLPAAARDLALRLGASAERVGLDVRLTQSGLMKRTLGVDAWSPFTASQTIATNCCRFDWRARFGPLGAISVRDALEDGEGRLTVNALGIIPLGRTKPTAALTKGELMRYLAELPWAPDAILHNPELRWRAIGPDTIVVSAGVGDTSVEVSLGLNTQGQVATVLAKNRPRSPTPPLLPMRWVGGFSDYRLHDGRWLPFAGEVAWEIDGHNEVYWICRVEAWCSSDGQSTAESP